MMEVFVLRCIHFGTFTTPLENSIKIQFHIFFNCLLGPKWEKAFCCFCIIPANDFLLFSFVSLFNFALNNYVSFKVVSLSNILNYFALSLADWFLVQTIYRIEVSKILQHLLSIQLFTQIPCGMQKL